MSPWGGSSVRLLSVSDWKKLSRALSEHFYTPRELLSFGPADFTDILGYSMPEAERLLSLLSRAELFRKRMLPLNGTLLPCTDARFPQRLPSILRGDCPPLLYCYGDVSLLRHPAVGYAGVRDTEGDDLSFVRTIVERTVSRGYFVVSGGARGIDAAAETGALLSGGSVIEFPAVSINERLEIADVRHAVESGTLLLVSAVPPDIPFDAPYALRRNRYLYAMSEAAVIAHAHLEAGGTWSGACNALKGRVCPILVRNKPEYSGNMALIRRGAEPIDKSWDGDIRGLLTRTPIQQKLFDA